MKPLGMLFVGIRGAIALAWIPHHLQEDREYLDSPCSQRDLAYSPPVYPSPWMDPNADGWAEAYVKAKDFVSQLTLLEKVNLTTGVG